ncbi:hypothetical protein D3C80_1451070 [compost metagenome]
MQRPRNAARVAIDGAELSLSLRALPYLEGFGLTANAAWLRGRALAIAADGGERRLDFLPQQSEWLANLMVFYERGPFEAYVSYAYVGDARTTVGPTPPRTASCWPITRRIFRSAITSGPACA